VFSSLCLGVPFIAPRQLGAIGGQLGRPKLPSVGWCTEQSGAPPDSHCSSPMRDLLPYSAHLTVGPWGRLAHRTLSGAHRTVRCAQPTIAVGHASPRITQPTVASGDRWLTGQSGAPPDSPVNYSLTPLRFPESSRFTASQPAPPNSVRCMDTVWCTTEHCPVHHRTVRCAWPALVLAAHSQLFFFSFLLLLSLF
jgi:hypothetical protein